VTFFADWYPEGGADGPDYLEPPDLIILGDHKLPGRSRITSGGVAYKFDVKDPKGKNTARPTFSGMDRTKRLTIDHYVWTKRQKELSGDVYLSIAPSRGGDPVPMRIIADQIADLDIRDVVVVDVGEWREQGKGWSRTVSCLIWAGEERAHPDPVTRKPHVVRTPARSLPRNARAEDAAARANPKPTAQVGLVSP